MSVEAMKQALEALKLIDEAAPLPVAKHAIKVLRKAIETTLPSQREWVGLTIGEVAFLVPYCENKWDLEDYKTFAKDIEAKLKEKNA